MNYKRKNLRFLKRQQRGRIYLSCLVVLGLFLPFKALAEFNIRYVKASVRQQPYTLTSKVPQGQKTALATNSSKGFSTEIGTKINSINTFFRYDFNTSQFQRTSSITVLREHHQRHRLSLGTDFKFLFLYFQTGVAASQEYFHRSPNGPIVIIDRIWMPLAFANMELPIPLIDDHMSDIYLSLGILAKAAALPPIKTGNIKTKHGENFGAGGFLRFNWIDLSFTYSRQRQDTSSASQVQTMLELELGLKIQF